MVQITDLTKSNVEVRPVTDKPETNYTVEPEKQERGVVIKDGQEWVDDTEALIAAMNQMREATKDRKLAFEFVNIDGKIITDKRAIQKKTCKIKPMPKVIDWDKIKKYGT